LRVSSSSMAGWVLEHGFGGGKQPSRLSPITITDHYHNNDLLD
jgi:hypothetical protein